MTRRWRWGRGRRQRGQAIRGRAIRGQAMLELALVMPLMAFFVLAAIQAAIVFSTYLAVIGVTRDVGRWVSVHPHVTDATTSATVRARLPRNVTSSRLTLTYTPPCATLSSGKCTARSPGTQIAVASTYDISDILFLPASFGYGSFVVAIPRTLPTYTLYFQVEPS